MPTKIEEYEKIMDELNQPVKSCPICVLQKYNVPPPYLLWNINSPYAFDPFICEKHKLLAQKEELYGRAGI